MTPQRLSKSYKIEENFLKDFGDNRSATKLDKYVSERFHSTIFHRYVSTLNKSNQAFVLEDVITM